MKDFHRIRAGFYRILASPYYKESTTLYLEEFAKHLPVFRVVCEMAESSAYNDALAMIEPDLCGNMDTVIDRHKRAFARIFLSTGFAVQQRSVIPVESVYLSGKRMIMQEQRDQVMEFYYGQGWGKRSDFTEPEDHLAAELHFMADMAEKSNNDDRPKFIEIQHEFLREHLIKWIDPVTADLYTVADTLPDGSYFKGIAKLTQLFVHLDYAVTENLLI